MAGTESVRTLPGEGQDHPGGHHPVLLHQHGAVVERGISREEIQEQVHRKARIEMDAGIEEILRPQVAAHIQHHQRPTPGLGQPPGRLGEGAHGSGGELIATPISKQHPESTGAEQFHQPAQIALPQDRQGQAAGQHESIDQLAGEGKGRIALHHPGQGHQKEITPQQPEGAGFLDPPEQKDADGSGKSNICQQQQEIPGGLPNHWVNRSAAEVKGPAAHGQHANALVQIIGCRWGGRRS